MFFRNNNNESLNFKLKTFNIKNDDFNNIFNILNTTYSKINNNKNKKKIFFPKIKKNYLNNIDYNNNLKQSHSVKSFLSKRRFLIQNFNKTNEKLFHKNFIKKKILTINNNNNNNNNDSLNENDFSSKIKTIFIDDKINFIKTHLQSFKNNNKNNNNKIIINNKGNFNLKNLNFCPKKNLIFHTKIIDNKDGSICYVYDKNYKENDYKLNNNMKKFKEKNKSIENFIKNYNLREKNNIKKRCLSKEEIKRINKSVFEDKNIFKKLFKINKN